MLLRKIAIIGDVHGRSDWQKADLEADKVIFMGDDFDSFDISVQKQMDNFNKILQFKKDNPERVVLLFGNHDFHYLPYAGEKYSGYNVNLQLQLLNTPLHDLIQDGTIQAAYNEGPYLFTHAGLTQYWLHRHFPVFQKTATISGLLNWALKEVPTRFRFSPANEKDRHGDSKTQGPFWIRPESLYAGILDQREFYHKQIVGHTRTNNPYMFRGERGFLMADLQESGQTLILYPETGLFNAFNEDGEITYSGQL